MEMWLIIVVIPLQITALLWAVRGVLRADREIQERL